MSLLSGFDLEQMRNKRGGGGGPTDPPDPPNNLPQMTPMNAMDIANGYAVQGHPHRQDLVYAGNGSGGYSQINIDTWVDLMYNMGARRIRARYNRGSQGCQRLAARCRLRGMKVWWSCVGEGGSIPTDNTPAETRTAVRNLIADVADVAETVEGINEPNHNRGGGAVPLDWATNATYGAVTHQEIIWEEVTGSAAMAGVKVLGPSLQDNNADASYTDANPPGGKFHFDQMADAGILGMQHYAGQHSYAGKGNPPTYKLASRIDLIDQAYGNNYPVWITETGYTTAIANTTSGHAIASEPAAATYGPRMLMEFAKGYTLTRPRFLRFSRFEGLDDYNPNNAGVENHFGLWRVGQGSVQQSFDPSTWNPKPEVAKMQAILNVLRAPDGTQAYTPDPIGLKITLGAQSGDVRTLLAQSHDDTVRLFYWRNQAVMNTATKQTIAVPNVPVVIEDANGPRTVQANGEVQWTIINR